MSAAARSLSAAPGSTLLGEIREQADSFARVADGLRGRDLVLLVAHGSSDNAASYGVYAFGMLAGRTAVRDSISLSIYYGADIDFRRSAVVALSQSGRTPDVVQYVERARSRGAYTIAVTNDAGSDLAAAADAVLPLGVGVERAVAATKTYSAQLAALAMLAAASAGRVAEVADAVRITAGLLGELLPALEAQLVEVAVSLAFVGRMFVIGGRSTPRRARSRSSSSRRAASPRSR